MTQETPQQRLKTLLESTDPEKVTERREFVKFLKRHLCPEGYFLYLDVKDFKNAKSDEDKIIAAQRIVKQYFSEDSVSEVNVGYDLAKEVLSNVKPNQVPSNDVFDKSVDAVLATLAFDGFCRFEREQASRKRALQRIEREQEERALLMKGVALSVVAAAAVLFLMWRYKKN